MSNEHAHGTEHDASTHHHSDGGESTTGIHGMLVFGDRISSPRLADSANVLYFSHLPMFGTPHNFQVILEVGLDARGMEELENDIPVGSGGIYTFEPEVFPIAELDPGGDGPARTTIVGNLFRGHFERHGTPIAEGVTARIHNVVHFNEFDIDAQPPDDQELTYLCFGRPGRIYLAHEITAAPNFDQVLAVRFVPGTVTNQAGSPLSEDVATIGYDVAQPVRFSQPDRVGSQLLPGSTAKGFFFRTASITGAHGFDVDVEVEKEVYLEIGELEKRHQHP